MKRPPGLWILLSAGVLWLSLQDVYGIRATALIFGKSSTSTTSEPSPSVLSENTKDEVSITTETPLSSNNSTVKVNDTSPILTGIPQVDYVWDPNLPQVLKGYNLSEYPFYERVPNEEIEFKCDGLHDGFYASIPHKCQVYHHCLFGTRYDFLCANYTAFDQKTFICQFVSEVDCVNSKKFWHRNDALYKAQSTTTGAPINLRAAIYTTSSPDGSDSLIPLGPKRTAGGSARRPYRPTRRRRPQFDYYDDEYYEDYYDDRPRSNRGRKRPRPRPRPVYDDDYEEYEDERYQSKRGGSRRRPYRDRRRNNEKRKTAYDDAEDVEERFEDEDFIASNKRKYSEERHKNYTQDDEEEEEERDRPNEKNRSPADKRESNNEDRKLLRKGSRRPVYDEYEDELPKSDDSGRYEDRPRKKQKVSKEELTNIDGRPIIKPSTGTIYDRPRVAPRINLPVPKNAADKYAYTAISMSKTITITTTPSSQEYDDEEYEEMAKRSSNRERRPLGDVKEENLNIENSSRKPSGSRSKTRIPDSDEIIRKPTYQSRNRYRLSSNQKEKPAVSEEYEDQDYLYEEKEFQEKKPSLRNEQKSKTTTPMTTTTTELMKKERHEYMRIIKRPFLPSRGGSTARGLQLVGLKAGDIFIKESDPEESSNGNKTGYVERGHNKESYEDSNVTKEMEKSDNLKTAFKPSPVLSKVPVHPKYTHSTSEKIFNSEPLRQQIYNTKEFSEARTTLKPKTVEKNPLDLNEYDVTLNDALNPTLSNLPVRAFPTGFSSTNDYNYNDYPRSRYVLEPVSPTNQKFMYPNKIARPHQRYERVPNGQLQYSTISGGYRQQDGQMQRIFSGY